MKPITYTYKSEETPLYYEVEYRGEIVFKDPCYSICNSYIFINQLMGTRPKPVYA